MKVNRFLLLFRRSFALFSRILVIQSFRFAQLFDQMRQKICDTERSITSVPVGHFWKFDLEKTFSLDFGMKCNFSKNSNRVYHAQVSRDNRKDQKNRIRRIELQSQQSSQK